MTPRSLADLLAAPAPPWVHLLVCGDGAPATLPVPPPGVVVRTLDGRRCRTKRALLGEMARVLEFPAYFGRTWDALEDCLTDLGWLPGAAYWLLVTSAHRLLVRDPAGYATLVALLEDVGRAWGTEATGHPARGPVPFHTVLAVPRGRLGARPDWGAPSVVG
ncbi:MAG TPA: barstar family protein [Methylomirabilota bacterium]|nr:barstar family protein [Methylomirabilota bacterium]